MNSRTSEGFIYINNVGEYLNVSGPVTWLPSIFVYSHQWIDNINSATLFKYEDPKVTAKHFRLRGDNAYEIVAAVLKAKSITSIQIVR